MPDSILSQIERRLIAARMPLVQRKRALQELSEHREDLIRAALDDGLSENAAAIRADNSLGNPGELVDQIVLAARRSSWAGRHPVTAFCVLPFFGSVLAMGLVYLFVLSVFYCFVSFPRFNVSCAAFDSVLTVYYGQIDMWQHLSQMVALAAAAFICCRLAVRSVSKRYWLWVACGICAVQGYLWTMTVTAHSISIGYFLWPIKLVPVESALIPIVIAVVIDTRQRRLQPDQFSLTTDGPERTARNR
jgi:hypothetical protein